MSLSSTLCVALMVAAAGGPKSGTKKPKPGATKMKWTEKVKQGEDLYATFDTSMGSVVVRLFSKEAPLTVANFVGLATGEKEWKHPKTGQTMKAASLYAGTIFHRVMDGFMIQGGDPLGTGTGDPGYRFADEFQSGRSYEKPGLLAMANSGPNSNGSQFFITVSTPKHLNNKHTIFGEVVSGYDVVTSISKVETEAGSRPKIPVVLKAITISEKAP